LHALKKITEIVTYSGALCKGTTSARGQLGAFAAALQSGI